MFIIPLFTNNLQCGTAPLRLHYVLQIEDSALLTRFKGLEYMLENISQGSSNLELFSTPCYQFSQIGSVIITYPDWPQRLQAWLKSKGRLEIQQCSTLEKRDLNSINISCLTTYKTGKNTSLYNKAYYHE